MYIIVIKAKLNIENIDSLEEFVTKYIDILDDMQTIDHIHKRMIERNYKKSPAHPWFMEA